MHYTYGIILAIASYVANSFNVSSALIDYQIHVQWFISGVLLWYAHS